MSTKNVPKKDYILLKLLLIGDYGVGKTSILNRFVEDIFDPVPVVTIDKTIELDEKKYKLQIWDIPVRCKPVIASYYRGTKGIMVVYDVTDSRSFDNTRLWLKNVKETASPDIEIVLLGNKCDEDEEKRQVSAEQGQQLAEEFGIPFRETSAKENINIDDVFNNQIETIIAKTDFELPQFSAQTESSNKPRSCAVL